MQTALTYRTNRDLFSNHYLDEHLPETEAWDEVSDEELQTAFEEISDFWEQEKSTAPKRNESQLEEKFIRPMFRKLGIPFEVEESTSRTQRRPDYGFFESEDAARGAFERREEGGDFYQNAVAVADAKRWGRPLDTRGSGEHERDFENPSYQIHVYLQETPVRWAILTDGKKWRLYYGPTSHRLDSYYEIDLPTVLEKGDLEDFKYFYLFFRHGAFLEDSSGECFLDEVFNESNVFARELGEGLQDNIYEAIKVLSEGFMQYPDNDLSEDDLDLIHDSSLIYLYRLIFVLYAEAEGRELLDTNNEIYEESYSLNSLKQDIAEEVDSSSPKYRDWQNNLWDRLDELFKLIDQGSKSRGIPEEDLYIPAYNGGLFRTGPDEDDSVEARFLANHQVGDVYLAEVIELLTRSQNGNGGEKIFVDYSSLDVRHLGSIYEGLLEYQLDVADEPLALEGGEYVPADEGDEVIVEEGEVHLSTGSGERKATGSYYTPEYVVEYIVKNTLEPLVDEIYDDLLARDPWNKEGGGQFAEDFADRIFELKILDPAMGSGHFLTNAIDYLARKIIEAQQKQGEQEGKDSVDQKHDIYWAKRQVAQRCIYGVDLNPLAVELSKVSLWLRTLAAEQPLAFLDHHLKTGNSLVGSDIEEIEELESDAGGDGQNATLADFGVARKGTIEQLMRIYQDFIAIENQDLADVKEMEAKYDEFERNKLRQRLEAMANVHTAEEFGLDNLPSDAYERMAAALEGKEWANIEKMQWFRDAQKWASEDHYFHWKLEFPEVFHTDTGENIENPGFDAVIGNPPYVRSINIKAHDKPMWSYYKDSYSTAQKGEYDIYLCFTELGTEILREGGQFGYILPNKWFTSQVGSELRSLLVEEECLREIVDFQSFQVFEGVTTYTCLLFLEMNGMESVEINALSDSDGNEPVPTDQGEWSTGTVSLANLDGEPWSFSISPLGELFDSLKKNHVPLEEYLNVFKGLGTDADPVYCLERRENGLYSHELEEFVDIEDEILRPAVKGTDIDPYHHDVNWSLIFPYRETDTGVELMDGDMIEEKYPEAWSYLNRNRDRLEERESGRFQGRDDWFAYSYPRSMHLMGEEKILLPDVVKESEFSLDWEGCCLLDTAYGIIAPDLDYGYLTSLLNTDILTAFLNLSGTDLRGGYFRMKTAYLNPFPVPKIEFTTEQTMRESLLEDGKNEYRRLLDGNASTNDVVASAGISDHKDVAYELLSELASKQSQLIGKKRSLNLNLLDYLGNYSNGPNLPDVGFFQPSGSNILHATTEEYDKLRLGDVKTECDSSTITVYAKTRYKPEDEDEYETDRWGYTETDYFKAFSLTDLTEKEATLVDVFVPVAVEKGDGFAGFRDNATKTNSPIDRLKAITLPDPDDVAADLQRFIQTKEHAEELDDKIENTDKLIDQIVYDLYGLTDEEIEIVESAVQDD